MISPVKRQGTATKVVRPPRAPFSPPPRFPSASNLRLPTATARPRDGAEAISVLTTVTPSATAHASAPHGKPDADDPLDPSERRRAQMGSFPLPPPLPAPPLAPPPVSSPPLPASLELLLPALVRRIAWSGDARRGVVRMELGAGELAGGVLVVHANGSELCVHLSTPPGADPAAWRARLSKCLTARGLSATVDVD